MKSSRTKMPLSAKKPIKPRNINISSKDPVKVYCRIRPMQKLTDESCIKIISPTTILITPPESSVNYRSNNKDIETSFTKIFEDDATQKIVFNEVALPFVENLLTGKNSLLFTYGVTGSGKTYTMTGDKNDIGMMPRCLDVLFNSIKNNQAKKYIFKSDKMNGFDIQNDNDALLDRQAEINAALTAPKNAKKAKKTIANDSDADMNNQLYTKECDESQIIQIDQDNLYAVFVTYVEIYNKGVYDLLDESDEPRGNILQSKSIKDDGNKHMFVHGVTEVEVTSSDDAFKVFCRGQKKRRVAHTVLNAESSRSHSVFTIRLVQAPLDCDGENIINDKRVIRISQLSLVDLAGSERTNRTNNTGQRLREAGNINNSLMTLRTCLEILRDNQINGTNKIVPYRDSKLTQLFKNFFDGDGSVKMIICINPSNDDYDETIQVIKFSEITQDVQTNKTNVQKIDMGFTPGRRLAYNKIIKDKININNDNNNNINYNFDISFPDVEINNPHDDTTIKNIINFLHQRIDKKNTLQADLSVKNNNFNQILKNVERHNIELRVDNNLLKNCAEKQKEQLNKYCTHVSGTETQNDKLLSKLKKSDELIKTLKQESSNKDHLLNQAQLNQAKLIKDYDLNYKNEINKIKNEQKKLIENGTHKVTVEKKNLEDKLRRTQEVLDIPVSTIVEENNVNVHDAVSKWNKQQSTIIDSKKNKQTVYYNRRNRRSQSAAPKLPHQTREPVKTVMQSNLKNNNNKSRYCLNSREHDSDDVIEVISNIENLKQTSPIIGKKRSSNKYDIENISSDNKRTRVNR
ncbi:hypothetical protein HCN44_009495 [Aphidius gifuensis]|uniref:Kinesin-like protein n=1 Tax=Aphidius gifuensis TaxID=684658 RepID=A0A834Y583_APHGI|nr:kinesin-like protein KIF23 [Aphidius gifuensis]KAF7998097.1 hypothetical protein HCN44_009495 [Aphidius gifuensis]